MTPDIIGICVTIGVSIILAGIMIGLAVFLGLRNFTGTLSDKISNTKDAITGQLAPIKEILSTLDERTENIWQYAQGKLSSSTGTVEKYLTNFAKTTITAEPGRNETVYTIQIEKGTINSAFIAKVSERTGLNNIEKEFFGKLVSAISLTPNRLRVTVPSTDPKLCTKYISTLLKWLDSEYIEALHTISEFETNIEV